MQAHHQRLAEWTTQKDRPEADLARQVPEMNLEKELLAADRRAVALGLPEGVALVEFVRFHVFDFHAVPARGESHWKPARYLAFVLHAREPDEVQMIDLGEAEPIDQLIANFRQGLTGEGGRRAPVLLEESAPDTVPASPEERLRKLLFEPLLPALSGRTRLYLSPDGDLCRLPFEALPDGSGHLIDNCRISYLSTGRDVLRFGQARSAGAGSGVVMADPDYDLSGVASVHDNPAPSVPVRSRMRDLGWQSLSVFPPLPGAAQEGAEVSGLLGVTPWTGTAATKGRLKNLCSPVPQEGASQKTGSPRILHLATHGFFLPDPVSKPPADL